jgi:hypothetical protein
MLAALAVPLAAGVLCADERKLTPSIALRQEYNDNIFFDDRDEEDDFVTRLRPGIEFVNRTERLDLKLAGFLTPYLYWDKDELNAVDQDYSGRVSWRATPLASIGAEAAVRVDHQPDRDVLTTGLAYGDNRRLQQTYGANAAVTLTERTAASAAYTHGREDWRNTSAADDLEDYRSHAVTLGLSRELGAAPGMTVGGLNAGWATYDYESSETDYYFASVGVKHRLSEIFNLSADLGGRYTDSRFDVQRLALTPGGLRVVTRGEEDSGFGGIAHLGVEYAGERARGTLTASHDVNAASGSRGVVQRSGLSFNGGYLVLEKLRIGLFASAFKNQSDSGEFQESEVDEVAVNLRPSLRWELFRDVTLEAGYAFTYLDDRAADEDARRNLGYIQIAYGLPLLD